MQNTSQQAGSTNNITNQKIRLFRSVILGVIVGLVLLILIGLIPLLYSSSILGPITLTLNAYQVIGNQTNATLVAKSIMSWINQNTLQPYNYYPPLYSGPGWELFIAKGMPYLYIPASSDYISWFMVSKLGNCGEDAAYFATMMNEAGFHSQIINAVGDDHSIAEYYDASGKPVFVDPSLMWENVSAEFISNTLEEGAKWSWFKVMAINLSSGAEEDITKQFVSNTSVLEINLINNTFLAKLVSIEVDSSHLEDITANTSKRYKTPQTVVVHDFTNSSSYQTVLGDGNEYQLVTHLLFFKTVQPLNLSNNQTVEINPMKMVSLENVDSGSVAIFAVFIILIGVIIFEVKLLVDTPKRKTQNKNFKHTERTPKSVRERR
jgi:hypothetical protein